MNFSEMLRKHMDENKLTQCDVAKALGCSQVMISKYLSGESVPERPTIAMRAGAFLDVDLDELFAVIAKQKEVVSES